MERPDARSLSEVEGSRLRSERELATLAVVLFAAVGGAVERGGRSWTILRWVKEGISGQCRYSDSMAESKYEPM